MLCRQWQASPHAQPFLSPTAAVSGTLVLLELQLAPEPVPQLKDASKDPKQGQLCSPGTAQPNGHQAAWKDGSPGNPATTQEPSEQQKHQVEQPPPSQPSAGSQVQTWQRGLRPSLPGASSPVGEGLMVYADCSACFSPCSLVPLCMAMCQGWLGGAGSSHRVSAVPWGGRTGALPQSCFAPLPCSTCILMVPGRASALGT